MIILFFAADQSFSIMDINILANEGGIAHTLLLVASCCLIAAVMSKSGQFILHTWLPDAMAGPTPVSALIHAATMVVAGIYMVARLYPVFFEGLSIAGSSVNLLAVVGAVTALFGALLAFVQKDIKKVLAYSTVSPARLHGDRARRRGVDRGACSTSSPTPSSRPACSSAPARSATPATTASTWSTTWAACGRSCPRPSGPT